jgi:hypothetical protein
VFAEDGGLRRPTASWLLRDKLTEIEMQAMVLKRLGGPMVWTELPDRTEQNGAIRHSVTLETGT